jgi:hypothetical protein
MTNCGIVLGVQGNGPTKLRALRDYYYPFMKARARECFGHVGLFVCLFSFLDSCFYFLREGHPSEFCERQVSCPRSYLW